MDKSSISNVWFDLILNTNGEYTFYMCPLYFKQEVAEKFLLNGLSEFITEEYGGKLSN